MKNIKKFLGVVAVVLAAPLFLGGTVACGKDCKARCEDYNKACGTTTNCTTNCDPNTACSKEADNVASCFNNDCSCTKCATDPSDTASCDKCTTLVGTTCKTQVDAYNTCLGV